MVEANIAKIGDRPLKQILLWNVGWGVHLFGTGAVNAKIDEIWCKTPAMNFSPTADIPCLEDPSDAMKTFLPFCHKLTCTWEPEPMSSSAYLSNDKKS